MPSTLTHYVFNKQLIKDEKYKDIFKEIAQNFSGKKQA